MPQGSFIRQEGAPVRPHCPGAAHHILRVSQYAQVGYQEPVHGSCGLGRQLYEVSEAKRGAE